MEAFTLAKQRALLKRYGVVQLKLGLTYLRWCSDEHDGERVMETLTLTAPELWERTGSEAAILRSIANDQNESFSNRQDAKRVLELADIRPQEFKRDYAELMARRKEGNQ